MAVLSSHTSMPCNIHTGHSLQTARRRKVYWPAVRVPKGQPNLASTGRPFLSYRLARHHASTADGFTGGDSLQGLNRVGPEICLLVGLTNLIYSLIFTTIDAIISSSWTRSAYRARRPVLYPMMPSIAGVKASTGRTREAHDFPLHPLSPHRLVSAVSVSVSQRQSHTSLTCSQDNVCGRPHIND